MPSARRAIGVLEEQLVEIAHPEEQQRIRVGAFISRYCAMNGVAPLAARFAGGSALRDGRMKPILPRVQKWPLITAPFTLDSNPRLPAAMAPRPPSRATPLPQVLPSSAAQVLNMTTKRPSLTDEEALPFHCERQARESSRSSPPSRWRRSATCRSPIRRASPCRCWRSPRIPTTAYDYTAKGNLVAVISNGTAILGLGDLGALASKPVMEGKAVLFKRFADVDSIDIEVDTEDVERIHQLRCAISAPTFGGINLEDIKAPECFIIEQRLRELMDIPVFHDDQHGTAIIAAAGLINALRPHRAQDQGRQDRRATAPAPRRIACIELIKAHGRAARKRHALRHQGRDLSGPRRRA